MTQKAILAISGMHCASCAKIIETTIEERSGVSSISVNYNSRKAFVEFNQQETNLGEIKKEIEELGYKASE